MGRENSRVKGLWADIPGLALPAGKSFCYPVWVACHHQCGGLLVQTKLEAWPRIPLDPFGSLDRARFGINPNSLTAPSLPALPLSNPNTVATKRMISTTPTDHFRGTRRLQKGTVLKIGLFCLLHKESGPARTGSLC